MEPLQARDAYEAAKDPKDAITTALLLLDRIARALEQIADRR